MFAVGEKVVHPMHGAGTIEAITQECLAGETEQYYVFRMPSDALTLKIPTGNSGVVGLRRLLSRERMEELLKKLPTLDAEMVGNWNCRYRDNLAKLKSGDILELARVIKGLAQRELSRGLSTGERKMLQNAKRVLLSELAFVKELPYEAAEKLLQKAMMGN